MSHYLSMEHLKLQHSHINWLMVVANVIAAGFTVIWLLTSPLQNSVRLATFQNNFSTIWIFLTLTVLAIEKIRQERNAGNFFNVRESVIDTPKYYHALLLNLYWSFLKGFALYEVAAIAFLAFIFGLSDINFYQGFVLPILFIAIFAAWLLPVIYLLVINLNNVIGVVVVIGILASALSNFPTPWSFAIHNIAYIAGVKPNGLALGHYSNVLIWPTLLTTFVMFALLEGILYLYTRRHKHDK